jgi:hypothetical protein
MKLFSVSFLAFFVASNLFFNFAKSTTNWKELEIYNSYPKGVKLTSLHLKNGKEFLIEGASSAPPTYQSLVILDWSEASRSFPFLFKSVGKVNIPFETAIDVNNKLLAQLAYTCIQNGWAQNLKYIRTALGLDYSSSQIKQNSFSNKFRAVIAKKSTADLQSEEGFDQVFQSEPQAMGSDNGDSVEAAIAASTKRYFGWVNYRYSYRLFYKDLLILTAVEFTPWPSVESPIETQVKCFTYRAQKEKKSQEANDNIPTKLPSSVAPTASDQLSGHN